MRRYAKLFEPLKLNEKYTMKNRVVCAPMAFALIACDPEASEKSFRKLEAPARGGGGDLSEDRGHHGVHEISGSLEDAGMRYERDPGAYGWGGKGNV